jgi:transcription initiation factor TFIIIB Brf1 subunit/transcription initiation factor TFIIB
MINEMAFLLPALQRRRVIAAAASQVDTFLQRDNFEEEDLGVDSKAVRAAADAAATACPTCGVAREDWTFDNVSICGKCGIVMERPIDTGAEYRFFGLEERGGGDPCRVGAPMDSRFPSSGLGTIILSHAHGGNSSTRIAMARVRRYHTWNLLPYRERSLLQVFEQIALAATNHGFDQRTMDIAKDMYVKLVEHCDRRGMSRTSVVASSIYSSLKKVGHPRKPKEIADIFHLSTAQFTKSLKYFQEILCMAHQRGLLADEHADPAAMPSTRASDYISHPLSKLPICRNMFQALREKAVTLADLVEDREICPENMPPSLAAGVIAFLLRRYPQAFADGDVTYEKIAVVCEVSEGTLQKCLKKLEAAEEVGLLLGPK